MQRDRRAETGAYVMGIECPPLEAFGYSISKTILQACSDLRFTLKSLVRRCSFDLISSPCMAWLEETQH